MKAERLLIVDGVRTPFSKMGADLARLGADELGRIAQVRNVMGCHFNELSFDLLDSDGVDFGAKVLELMDALVEPDGGWPKGDKSGSYWANSDDSRRLHPLKKPK